MQRLSELVASILCQRETWAPHRTMEMHALCGLGPKPDQRNQFYTAAIAHKPAPWCLSYSISHRSASPKFDVTPSKPKIRILSSVINYPDAPLSRYTIKSRWRATSSPRVCSPNNTNAVVEISLHFTRGIPPALHPE
jgi:hypothetical protein